VVRANRTHWCDGALHSAKRANLFEKNGRRDAMTNPRHGKSDRVGFWNEKIAQSKITKAQTSG